MRLFRPKHAPIISIALLILVAAVPARADWNELDPGVNDDLYDVCFISADTGWASGWYSGGPGGVILKTTDLGENWSAVRPVAGSFLFSVHFLNSLKGFAVGCDAGGTFYAMILKTTNGGANW